jgi:hypothetical protein
MHWEPEGELSGWNEAELALYTVPIPGDRLFKLPTGTTVTSGRHRTVTYSIGRTRDVGAAADDCIASMKHAAPFKQPPPAPKKPRLSPLSKPRAPPKRGAQKKHVYRQLQLPPCVIQPTEGTREVCYPSYGDYVGPSECLNPYLLGIEQYPNNIEPDLLANAIPGASDEYPSSASTVGACGSPTQETPPSPCSPQADPKKDSFATLDFIADILNPAASAAVEQRPPPVISATAGEPARFDAAGCAHLAALDRAAPYISGDPGTTRSALSSLHSPDEPDLRAMRHFVCSTRGSWTWIRIVAAFWENQQMKFNRHNLHESFAGTTKVVRVRNHRNRTHMVIPGFDMFMNAVRAWDRIHLVHGVAVADRNTEYARLLGCFYWYCREGIARARSEFLAEMGDRQYWMDPWVDTMDRVEGVGRMFLDIHCHAEVRDGPVARGFTLEGFRTACSDVWALNACAPLDTFVNPMTVLASTVPHFLTAELSAPLMSYATQLTIAAVWSGACLEFSAMQILMAILHASQNEFYEHPDLPRGKQSLFSRYMKAFGTHSESVSIRTLSSFLRETDTNKSELYTSPFMSNDETVG